MEQGGQLQTTEGRLRSFELSHRIVNLASQAVPRVEFLRGLSDLLLQFSDCDALEIRVHGQVKYRLRASARPERSFLFEPFNVDGPRSGSEPFLEIDRSDLGRLVRDELEGKAGLQSSCFTPYGSFWTGDALETVVPSLSQQDPQPGGYSNTESLALVPFVIDDNNFGILQLECAQRDAFARDTIELYEALVETVGLAIAERRAKSALRERVKELTCLYSIARVIEDGGDNQDAALTLIAETLPPAWQYPELAVARIVLDESEHATGDIEATCSRQVANIVVNGVSRGTVEVGYIHEVPYVVSEPFLQEERHLINAVAREVGEFVKRRQASAERSLLEQQLRHADRLATIGHLAAGVAHEINEPLSSILGFAQLAKRDPTVTGSPASDLDKVVASCLQAREIVNKLKLFARQAPIQKTWMSLADIVEDACSLVEGRCRNEGIDIVTDFDAALPNVHADQIQLKQVLINLIVNAMQAMPDGGTLAIATRLDGRTAVIDVRDTGIGIAEDVVQEIFSPFFTTKDVGEGTGLGLSVVHGIVTAHGGTIDVESEAGNGAKFIVRLPLSATPGDRVGQEPEP
jgi:signal transduction histidine kinase